MKEFLLASIPSHLWLEIATYFDKIRSLNALALSNRNLYMMFFCKKERKNVFMALFSSADKDAESFSDVQRMIWLPLLKWYFPHFQTNLNVKNYMMVLKRRIKLLMEKSPKKLNNFEVHLDVYSKQLVNKTEESNNEMHYREMIYNISDELSYEIIENCDWIYKCPIDFNQMTGKHFKCDVCKKNVYHVRSLDDFAYHTDMGHCVTFSHKGSKIGGCLIY